MKKTQQEEQDKKRSDSKSGKSEIEVLAEKLRLQNKKDFE